MVEIAGRYKLTKLESVSYNTGAAQDITSMLTSCELLSIYNFNADGTATYTEVTNCNGSGSGTWNLSEAGLNTSFTTGSGNRISLTSIVSWDCTNLVLITRLPSVTYNYRYTLTKL
jgi:Lipocalin-like domain